ncbi:hypothetical protein NQ317_004864 [Molorchus minor]|uniref:Mini-chromosome maintenance complex-binding protein n=1 Tax=Molorchus minor TaxID=1323400 RepID=A0ABQ9J7M4_9CUCU|nr:hypothetical protein NQ317_004864 [Molorchus minor]
MEFVTCTLQEWIENEEQLLKKLQDLASWDEIPLLNVNELHQLKDGALVRFRGMIQDMHSPEYYLEKIRGDACVSNEDVTIDFNNDLNVTAERHTYVVISIPGTNEWVRIADTEKYKIQQDVLHWSLSKPTKRSLEETMDVGGVNSQKPSTSNNGSPKKACTLIETETRSSSKVLSKEFILNYPLPEKMGKTCHLKVYKDFQEFKLNNNYEFVGFLAIDPITEAEYEESEGIDNKMEMETLHPPSSLVPRIHCVAFKRLQHNNPLVGDKPETMPNDQFHFVRKELLIVLTQLLLGDELAAEYLLLHLISEVYLSRDLMPLGKFSLNISNIPQLQDIDYVLELYKFIETFVTKSYYLPMTLQNMNELSFIPKKDYECNRLTSGILQLSNNTHVVVDETKLSAGQLNSAGINSVKAIANAIKNQKVEYDFGYYPIEFECDIPFLILSEGKSMINVDTHVILKPENICLETFSEIIAAARHFLKPELLNDVRRYLSLARLIKYEISESVEGLVQNEFVNMRQRGHNKFSEDSSVEQSESEDNTQNENEYLEECDSLPSNEHETVSCYCSASHTDNISTDEHDSLTDAQEASLVRSIQQSDSGADLTEVLRQNIESDWNKFCAYINPDYLCYTQEVVLEGDSKSSGNTIDSNSQSKPEKFLFDDKDVHAYNELLSKDQRTIDKPGCSVRRNSTDLKNRILLRNLSGSDERLFTEVSEGWNPLSPLSIDCETEVERLLSSSLLVGSERGSSSSDSFSSVSSVDSSVDTEESVEDYQGQWNLLWKQHYENEYQLQYNKFLLSPKEMPAVVELMNMKCIKILETQHPRLRFCLRATYRNPRRRKKPYSAAFFDQVRFAGNNTVPRIQRHQPLERFLSNITVFSDDKSEGDIQSSDEDQENVEIRAELQRMAAMGLPVSFVKKRNSRSSWVSNCDGNNSLMEKSDSFETGRSRVKATFSLLDMEFQEELNDTWTGTVEYNRTHIQTQSRCLSMHVELKKPQHIFFDDDGNPIPAKENDEKENNCFCPTSTIKLRSKVKVRAKEPLIIVEKKVKRMSRKTKASMPPEILTNDKLHKYWHKRFLLFSKFGEGARLDEESWYSVTPEDVAIHAATRCKCDIIVDAFCGADGNTIQFAMQCNRVIAIDIDPKKVEMAHHNAQIYGVADKIDFIVGDFFKLAHTLKADVVFLSPPWGGPEYLSVPVYKLEEMLQPQPNSNTSTLIKEAGPKAFIEVEQNILHKKLIAITVYYHDLARKL